MLYYKKTIMGLGDLTAPKTMPVIKEIPLNLH